MVIIKNSNIGDCWQECNMSVVYVDTWETEDKNKISDCRDHVCGCWPVLPPSHYSVTQHPGQYCHLSITPSPSTLASTATFPLLGQPAPWPVLPPSHYSVIQLWNPLVLSTSVQDCWRVTCGGGIQMLFVYFFFSSKSSQDEPIW